METEAMPPPPPPPAPRRGRRLFKLVGRVWILLGVAFVAYLFYSYRATGFDSRILSSGPDVTVT